MVLFLSCLSFFVLVSFDVFAGSSKKALGPATPASCVDIAAPGCSPAKINTRGWEDSPYVTPDDQKLYFMYTPWNFFPTFKGEKFPVKAGPDRPGHHHNASPWEDADLYVSTKNPDGTWGAPVNLPFNNETGDCCGMPSADGNQFYFAKPNPPGSPKMDIYMAKKNPGAGWGRPEWLGPSVNTKFHEDNPHISKNGMTLYFMSDRIGGFGKRDLYYSSRRMDGTWDVAVNMGQNINRGDEDLIWVSDDQTAIYFGRFNELTPFRSEMKNGKWTDPAPVHFGTNKIISEVSFSNGGRKAYFAVIDFDKNDIIISYSQLQPDGTWSAPKAVD